MDKKRRRDNAAPSPPAARAADILVPSEEASDSNVEVVLVEPFHGGSHKQLVELLVAELLTPSSGATGDRGGARHAVCTLPPRKWHWRLMAASMPLALQIPRSNALRVLFVTAMVNFAELLGLRPDLSSQRVRKVLYFHENQLTYPFQLAASEKDHPDAPRRKVAAEDFQVAWAQIVSCLAADELVFNSEFNRSSFLGKVDTFINKIPEPELRHRGLSAQLQAKSRVLYFPLTVPAPPVLASTAEEKRADVLTILWNHRWEYDKNPDEFFQTLLELESTGHRFHLIVLGEAFGASPPIFESARAKLEASTNVSIVHWGYAESKARYWELLRSADVVVSTSLHEFYGVAVLEAVLCGCYPLVPNRLVYPEFFHGANVFNTQRQLLKKLKYLCGNPAPARKFFYEHHAEFDKFTWPALKAAFESMLLGWRNES